jgi:hypothetical protein
VRSLDALVAAVEAAYRGPGPSLIVAKVNKEQAFVGTTPMDSKENKHRFVCHIEQSENRIILRPSSKEHGAAPKADPDLSAVSGNESFAAILFDGLKENDVDFVVGLPFSGLSAAQAMCMKAQSMRYVAVEARRHFEARQVKHGVEQDALHDRAQPRAPALRSIALRAVAPSASSASVRSMPSISNSSLLQKLAQWPLPPPSSRARRGTLHYGCQHSGWHAGADPRLPAVGLIKANSSFFVLLGPPAD